MAKKKTKGIIVGAVAACAIIGALMPDKDIESIELSIPSYQAEYDVNTKIPVDISILPDGANTNSVEYRTSSDSITFSDSTINTGSVEGTYEIYVVSNDIESNILSIDVVDISAREEAEKKIQEELLAKEAEEIRLAEEQAAKEAEEIRLAEEQAAKEAEDKRLAEEAEQKHLEDEQTVAQASQNQNSGKSSDSSGDSSNFNTYDNADQQQTSASYVLNTSTKKFHYPSCKSVKKIAPQNYATSDSSREELIAQNYQPCGNCSP